MSNTPKVLNALNGGPLTAKAIRARLDNELTQGEVYSALQRLMAQELVTLVDPPTIAETDARLAAIAKRIETLGTRPSEPRVRKELVYRIVDRGEAK